MALLRRFLVLTLVLALATPLLRAQEPASSGVSLLDEYNIEVFGAPDSSRMAAGLSFGTVYPTGWWWSTGPRLSWVRWNVDMPRQDGIGVGGTFGMGWHPERTVSPFAAVALDRVFNVSGRFDWQSVIHAGARVKVTTDPREYFAMTFSLYQSAVFGGDGPSGSDYGIAVLYSAALFARKR